MKGTNGGSVVLPDYIAGAFLHKMAFRYMAKKI